MKRKSALLAGAVALALGGVAQADVFGPGPGGPIPDGSGTLPNTIPGTLTSTIAVPAGSVISVNNVSITMGTGIGPTGAHTWVGDLVATLTSPGGDNVHLFARTGTTTSTGFGSTADLSGGPYVFVNSGGTAWQHTSTPTPIPPGTYNRSTTLLPAVPPTQDNDDYSVFVGDPSGGNWTLTLQDFAGGDTGGLVSWSLDITIPEPGSASLLVFGAGLPLLRRRRR
jgi:subtilisin-like proprotein convertase family protein